MTKKSSTCETDHLGSRRWYNDQGKFHREDGPAVEWALGATEYYLNGICHREDGPAINYMSGMVIYYLNGVEYSDVLTYWMAVAEWKRSRG